MMLTPCHKKKYRIKEHKEYVVCTCPVVDCTTTLQIPIEQYREEEGALCEER